MDRLRDLLRSTSPNLVFLIETKLNGDKARDVGRKMGYQNIIVVESIGCSSGLILMWKDD